MGAAFDDDLIHAVATVVSTEARAFNNFGRAGIDYWTPNINPFKDPRWGRGQETPGEDPYHLSSYVKSLINGLQGGHDPETKRIVATCKHWVAYDLENWNGNFRYAFDAQVTGQDLSEYYTPSFQACARDSNVGSFMCSYNALNGVPTCANSYILQDILRDHWNWTSDYQYVTSDCDAIQNIYSPHDYATDRAQAVADALNAGTDLDCGTYYPTHLPEALSRGLITEATLDQALTRLFAAQIKLGYFNSNSTIYRNLTWADVSTQQAQDLALKAAEEGITLLKNDGILPLKVSPNTTTLGLIGSWANATTVMQGNYFGGAPYLHSPLYAAQQLGFKVEYASGVGGQGDPTTDSWKTALAAANASDIIVIADGLDNGTESEGMDRYTVAWTAQQIDLAFQFAAMGKPVILLQMGAGQLDDTPFLNNPNISAIIWGGYPGQDGGTALFNVITGKTAPAGRLPITQYPADYVNQVPMTDMNLRPNATSGNPGRTYQWFDNATLPFGYGLHYTNFTVDVPGSNATYDIASLVSNCTGVAYLDQCPFQTISSTVKNTGSVTSDYVALGFLSGQYGPAPQPIRRLVTYQRLFSVAPGCSQTAELGLTLGSLARADETGDKVLYPGTYTFGVDSDAKGKPVATTSFTLTGEQAVLEQWPQPSST